MRAETASWPDWRDRAAYAPLIKADRSLFAWEWLRRNSLYCAACIAHRADSSLASADPGQFGLVAFEPPHRSVPEARPMWRSDVHPFVLRAHGLEVRRQTDMFDLSGLGGFASLLRGASGEHLLLSDGLRTIRIDGPPKTFTGGPRVLLYMLDGLASAEPPLLTLRRLIALCRTGRFARSLHRPETRARRWILLLRTWDALAAGAEQRQIAESLLSPSVAEPRWRSRESSVRSQVQRLVAAARRMGAGGYRELLRP